MAAEPSALEPALVCRENAALSGRRPRTAGVRGCEALKVLPPIGLVNLRAWRPVITSAFFRWRLACSP